MTKKKIMWNFQGSWWLGRGISRDLMQFCGTSMGGVSFVWNFRGLSKRNKKFQGVFKKVCPRPPCWFSFFGKAQSIIHNEFNGNKIE